MSTEISELFGRDFLERVIDIDALGFLGALCPGIPKDAE
jgi:hypothetical protein